MPAIASGSRAVVPHIPFAVWNDQSFPQITSVLSASLSLHLLLLRLHPQIDAVSGINLSWPPSDASALLISCFIEYSRSGQNRIVAPFIFSFIEYCRAGKKCIVGEKNSDTAHSYSKLLSKLDQMVRRMILEGLGVKEELDSHIQATTYKLRLSEHRTRRAEGETVLPDHLDANLLTIVCQHEIEGLEVQTKGGDWIHINPSPNSFTVLLGEIMEAWTNGEVHPTLHHVRMSGTDEARYSAIFFVFPKEGCLVQAPKELVDEGHPSLFKPFNFADFFCFRFSEEGEKAKHALRAYCGSGWMP